MSKHRPDGMVFLFTLTDQFLTWVDPSAESSPASDLRLLPTLETAYAFVDTGALDKFLTIHFRFGHLNYAALYNGLRTGSISDFKHSLRMVHILFNQNVPFAQRHVVDINQLMMVIIIPTLTHRTNPLSCHLIRLTYPFTFLVPLHFAQDSFFTVILKL